jgi:hypothetical protein
MKFEKAELDLIDACIKMSENLLKKFDEFYPIAFGITQSLKVINVATHSGNEFPDVNDKLEDLTKALKKSDQDNRFIGVAICSNVFVTKPDSIEKIDAVEIKFDMKEKYRLNFYIPLKYLLEDEKDIEPFYLKGNMFFYNYD